MEGRTVTCSFGVTEIQAGDTPETMLRRSDRALLTAKTSGRNTVVQLGSGIRDEQPEAPQPGGHSSRGAWPKDLIERDMVTLVPVKMAIEKLRGFVADHRARIISVDGNRVKLEIDDRPMSRFRRLTDRPTTFSMDLRFEEERAKSELPARSQSPGSGGHDSNAHQSRDWAAHQPRSASQGNGGQGKGGLGQLPVLPDGHRGRNARRRHNDQREANFGPWLRM